MERLLKNKVRYFLSSSRRGRSEIHHVLKYMQTCGTVAIIGGLLRDLALSSKTEKFRSDLDFVVDASHPRKFRDVMRSCKANVNRFGGYRLYGEHWTIDAWLLEDTWAHQAGHVSVSGFRDLLDTTFFNSDAIIYELSSGNVLVKPSYFPDLSRRLLEVNLLPNPNPIGSVVRALRLSVKWEFSWGPRLSKFVDKTLHANDWQTLVTYERTSYRSQTIDYFFRDDFRERLQQHVLDRRKDVFVPITFEKSEQLSLPI